MLIEVDSELPAPVLEALRSIPGIRDARGIRLD
jgi:hypothetical protein